MPAAPVWDAKAEAAAAKASALKKMGKGKVIEAPEGAVVVPGVSKRKRVKPEMPPEVEPTVRTEEVIREAEERARADYRERVRREVEELRARDGVAVNDEIFFDILLLIADGVPLRQVLRMPGMPGRMSFYRYLNCEDRELAAARMGRFTRARDIGFANIADEALEIAEDGSNDWVEREGKDGRSEIALDREHVQRSKLRVETRLKLLAVWQPERYGARLAHTDADGKPLNQKMSASDLAIALAKVIEAAKRNKLGFDEGGQVIEGEAREVAGSR